MAKKPEASPDGYLVGYARVSTKDQNLDLQLDALRKAGVLPDNLHVEKLSATAKKRPALDNAIRDLRAGDTLLVWRIDRLARNMQDLYERLGRVRAKGAKFRSITENFDFDTFTGEFVLGVLGLVAQLERQIIAQRTKAGIESWKTNNTGNWGRQRKLTEKQVVEAGKMLNRAKGHLSGRQVADRFGVSPPTIYQHWLVNRTGEGLRYIRQTKPK